MRSKLFSFVTFTFLPVLYLDNLDINTDHEAAPDNGIDISRIFVFFFFVFMELSISIPCRHDNEEVGNDEKSNIQRQ